MRPQSLSSPLVIAVLFPAFPCATRSEIVPGVTPHAQLHADLRLAILPAAVPGVAHLVKNLMENGVHILHGVISLAKIRFLDILAVCLVLAKLLHGFLTEIPARITTHPAGARGWRIDRLAARLWIFIRPCKITPPMKTAIAPQPIPVMSAVRPGQFAVPI